MRRELKSAVMDVGDQILRLCELSRFHGPGVWVYQNRLCKVLNFKTAKDMYQSLLKIKQILGRSDLPQGYGFRYQVELQLKRMDEFDAELKQLKWKK